MIVATAWLTHLPACCCWLVTRPQVDFNAASGFSAGGAGGSASGASGESEPIALGARLLRWLPFPGFTIKTHELQVGGGHKCCNSRQGCLWAYLACSLSAILQQYCAVLRGKAGAARYGVEGKKGAGQVGGGGGYYDLDCIPQPGTPAAAVCRAVPRRESCTAAPFMHICTTYCRVRASTQQASGTVAY